MDTETEVDTDTAAARRRETVATYDRIAPRYAARFLCSEPSPELGVFLGALAVSDTRGPVLDAGCGAAHDCRRFADRGRSVLGVDLSAGMLLEARRRFVGPLARADVGAIPVRDRSIGGVWCATVLLHLDRHQVPGALAELHRVLEPGGPLFLSVSEGDGSERRDDGGGHRWFTNYRRDELAALVEGGGFTVHSCAVIEEHNGSWLHVHGARPELPPP